MPSSPPATFVAKYFGILAPTGKPLWQDTALPDTAVRDTALWLRVLSGTPAQQQQHRRTRDSCYSHQTPPKSTNKVNEPITPERILRLKGDGCQGFIHEKHEEIGYFQPTAFSISWTSLSAILAWVLRLGW